MANKIQNDYRSHMQEASPDMDKLWNKIEQKIDAQQTDTKPAQVQSEQPQITASRGGFFKYAAVAACLVAVVASTVFFMNTKDGSVQKDTGKSSSYTLNNAAVNAADKDKQPTNDMAAEEIDAADDLTQKADNAAPTDRPTAETSADEAKNKVKELMMTHDYLDADKDQRLELVEQLAKQLKENGEITEYTMIKKENMSRVEITLPDGTIQGIILK